jgi:hypothetical protein
MSTYRRLVRVVTIVALALTVGPVLVLAIHRRSEGELFPLSLWSMFNRVYSQVDDYGIRILSIAGRPVASPPPYFENAGFEASQSVTAYHAIQKFAELTVSHEAGAEEARNLVERRYLAQSGVDYELVARRWDPLVRWKGGPFQAERPIERFTSQVGP